MAASLAQALWQVQRWTSSAQGADASDTALLERFIQRRDESAFAALVRRYGGMVLRQCRRVLGDAHEAEDAFQAVFLILARKAATIERPDALPGWLYGVARRVALKARTKSASLAFADIPLDDTLADPRPDPLTQLSARELLDVLDAEVRQLPASQRSAVVLCCLEGLTQEEAARRLGATAGSLKGHLERGRRRLHARLARRGIALSAALALAGVSQTAAEPLLLRSAVRAALDGASGQAAALAESVLQGMSLGKLASATVILLSAVVAISATAELTYRGVTTQPPDEQTPVVPLAAREADARKPEARTDALGDPLPAGAIARLGTVRFRHGGQIDFIAFTPDGKRLVSHGSDGVRVWNPVTGKELRQLASIRGGYGPQPVDLSPSPERTCVVATHMGFLIELWDVDSGQKIGSLGKGSLYNVRFSPDGKLLACCNSSNSSNRVELWDVASRKKLRSWVVSQDIFSSFLAFSADARKLLTSEADGKVRLWETATGRKLQEFTSLGHTPAVFFYPGATALSPDGKLVALIDENEKHTPADGPVEWKARITLWDAATGKQVRQLKCPTHEIVPGQAPSFRTLVFAPDSKSLVTGGPDHILRVWDANTGKECRRMPLDTTSVTSLALSRDGRMLAAVALGQPGTAIRVLDMTSGEATTPPGGHLMSVNLAVLTPDGRTAVTGGPENSLLVWDATTGRLRRRLEGHNNPVLSLQLASDGRTLFTSGWDKMLRVWDLPSGGERRRVPVDRDLFRIAYGGLIVTPDGKTVVMVDPKQMIRILDAATGAERQHFQGPEWMHGMGLTPDGRSLVGWSGDGKVRIWDVATGRKLREYPLPQVNNRLPTESNKAALSPDGRLLAIGHYEHPRKDGKEGRFLLFKDLATGRDVRRIDDLAPDFGLLAFSPDGRMLVWTTSYSPVIRLLEVASGRERRRLAGHRGQVTALAFTPDGARLISGSKDTTALIWDLQDGPGMPPATVTELETLWADLAGDDAARAYRAIRRLAAAPDTSVPFLRQRVRPTPAVDEKRLSGLIVDLDSDEFAVRQKAFTELDKLDEQPLAAYRKVLEGKPSIETRRRIEELREKAEPAWWNASGERLRALRAVEALELAGTKEAREVLKTLADGAEGARLTEQAKAALERLRSRGSN